MTGRVLLLIVLGGAPLVAAVASSNDAAGEAREGIRLQITLSPSSYSEEWNVEVKATGSLANLGSRDFSILPLPAGSLARPELWFSQGAFGILCDAPRAAPPTVFLLPVLQRPTTFEVTTHGRVHVVSTKRPGGFAVDLSFPADPTGDPPGGNHTWVNSIIGDIDLLLTGGEVYEIFPNELADSTTLPSRNLTISYSRLRDGNLLRILVQLRPGPLRMLVWFVPWFLLLIVPLFVRGNTKWLNAKPRRRTQMLLLLLLVAVAGVAATVQFVDPNLWDILLSASGAVAASGVEVLLIGATHPTASNTTTREGEANQ